MPEEFDEGHSPIDNFKTFNWDTAEAELDEFMNESDTENESDNASDVSTSSKDGRAKSHSMGNKRKHSETEDNEDTDDSDAESTLIKKQRIANSRSTGLKTVKTPSSEPSSLPTPGPTNDGEGGQDDESPAVLNHDENQDHEGSDGENDDFEDELEKELMEELEREEEARAASEGSGGVDGGG